MEARANDAGEYWSNYLGFQQNIQSDRDSAVANINLKTRMGSMAQAQADAAIAALDQEANKELEALKSGPTYQLLQEEYQAQRDYAQSEYDAQADKRNIEYREATPGEEGSQGGDFEWEGTPATAAGYYAIGESYNTGGDFNPEGDRDVEYLGEVDPRERDPFTFSSGAESYFSELFGDEGPGATTGAAAAGPSRRQAAGATSGTTVGVGKTYSWY